MAKEAVAMVTVARAVAVARTVRATRVASRAAAARVVAVRAAAVRAAVQIAASVAEANGEGGARTVGGCIAELRLAASATGLSSKLAFHIRRAGAGSV